MEWWGWLVTACGGVLAIWNAIKAVKEATRPFREQEEAVKKLQQQNAKDLERFDKINAELEGLRDMQHAICKSLFCMMNHTIDGNSIDKMKAAREELRTYIIDHK